MLPLREGGRTFLRSQRWMRKRRARTGTGRGERGQSLAEFAIIVPILTILVFGVIDFGMALRSYIAVTQSTREGARYGAVGGPAGAFTSGGSGQCDGNTTNTVVGKTCATMKGLNMANINSVSVDYPDGQTGGNSIVVATEYEYEFVTPVGAIVNALSGGSIGESLTLTSSSDMRLE
jgi:hypothetical protein